MKSIPRILALLLIFLSFGNAARTAEYIIQRVEPPCWWTGLKNSSLQLLVYGNGISSLDPEIKYKGVEVVEVVRVESPNYLFIYLNISEKAKAGSFNIEFFDQGKLAKTFQYELRTRETGSSQRKGFDPSDVMYLITPDRFANGNPGNDDIPGMMESASRSNPGGRHGGDIKGIADHLDYLHEMGFTAIWLNPVLENDMPAYSYHGYAATDFYNVDKRFGTNEDYRELSKLAWSKGIKLIMDMIFNHCGSKHWWMNDLPTKDWINCSDSVFYTNHKRQTVQDPWASVSDSKIFTDGWFVESMPDLNQRNPLMADYLIQNSIWWIEYAGLSGIRMDTYCYPDKDFMARWTCSIMDEYPDFNIVGEEWSENPAIVAFWQKGKTNPNGYVSCLPSMMDFPIQGALAKGLREEEKTWGSGLVILYEMLANDFLYADPYNLVTFPDNHDMSRFFTQINEDFGLYKMGIAYILTMRGIPQIYYGTELLMKNPGTTDHGIIRSDFPGGWPGDTINVNTGKGLSSQQMEAQQFMKNILTWRKTSTAIHEGNLIHFSPQNGMYCYFRFDEKNTVMVILNKNLQDTPLQMTRFSELTSRYNTAKDIISGKTFDLNNLVVPSRSAMILELSE